MNLKNSEEGLIALLVIFGICAAIAVVVWRVTDVETRVEGANSSVNQGLESGKAIEQE